LLGSKLKLQYFEKEDVNGEVWTDVRIKQSADDINMKGITFKFTNNAEQSTYS